MDIALVGFKAVCCEMSTLNVLACLPVLLPAFVCFVRPSECSLELCLLWGKCKPISLLLCLLLVTCVPSVCGVQKKKQLHTFNINKYVPE